MFDDSAIVRFYSYIDGSCKLMRIKYSCDENGAVTLGNVNEVHITYEDVAAAIEETGVEQATLITETVSTESTEEDFKKKKPSEEEPSEPDDEEKEDSEDEEFVEDKKETDEPSEKSDESEEVADSDEPKEDEEDKADVSCETTEVVEEVVDAACANAAVDAAQVTNAEVTETNEKVSVDNDQIQEADTGATSFTESERAELETLKREKKINLLNSYKEYLTDAEYTDFTSRIDAFEVDTLEVELLKKYKSHSEETPRNTMRAFALFAPKKEDAKIGLDDLVRKYRG